MPPPLFLSILFVLVFCMGLGHPSSWGQVVWLILSLGVVQVFVLVVSFAPKRGDFPCTRSFGLYLPGLCCFYVEVLGRILCSGLAARVFFVCVCLGDFGRDHVSRAGGCFVSLVLATYLPVLVPTGGFVGSYLVRVRGLIQGGPPLR